VGLRTALDAMVKRKIPSSCRDLNPRSSSPQGSKSRLPRGGAVCDLTEFSIPTKLGRLIKMCLNETYYNFRIGKDLSDVFPI